MSLAGSCFSSESAQGPSTMGFENEAEKSIGRPYRQTDSRSSDRYELTSSIVPRGTSFHRVVELACSPIACDPARLSPTAAGPEVHLWSSSPTPAAAPHRPYRKAGLSGRPI